MKKFNLAFLGVAVALGFSLLAPLTARSEAEGMEQLKRLPIQDSGRIKPLDTFARETLQLIYGKETYKPFDKPEETGTEKEGPKEGSEKQDRRERGALEIVFTWFLAPQFWDDQPILELKLGALKEALKLEKTRDRFSPREILNNDRIGLAFQDLASYRETKQKLTPYYQAVQRLESQLGVFQAVKEGHIFRVVPPKDTETVLAATKESMAAMGHSRVTPQALDAAARATTKPAPTGEMGTAQPMMKEPERWVAVSDLESDLKLKFSLVAKAFIRELPGIQNAPGDEAVPELAKAVDDFKAAARGENPSLYPSDKDMGLEVHYEELHPFRLAWILYVLSAIAMAIAWRTDKKVFVGAGWALAITAFLVHTYGFSLRMYLTGRPPVSNMYESVIWVSWGVMLFSFIFEYKQKAKFVLMSGAIVSTFCNIVADKAPHILDASLQPLEPVLRSNLWLTVHVLTISISYSAFFLAWALGNVGLGFIAKGESARSPRIESMTVSIYRCIQVGVVLLAAGIILGGIWADYSWGRFWGWDPKETWALIALLGYIAILHARLSGLIRQVGMLIGAVVGFSLVIMAWYGVNYVLGAGLHSYGFGAGGVEYVTGFVLADLAFVGYAFAANRAKGEALVA